MAVAGVSAEPTAAELRVLEILPGASMRAGGPPAFVGGSAVELAKLGIGVKVLATDINLAPWGYLQRQTRVTEEDLHPTLRQADLEVLPARFPRRLAYSPGLRKAIHEEPGDVIHIHNLWQYPQYAAHRVAVERGIPYVVSFHGGFDPYLRDHGRVRKAISTATWQRRMIEEAALVHVTTETERELTADIAPDVPRAIVPCGLYVEEFADLPPGEELRDARLGGYDGPLIVFLGRVTDKKGVDTLLRAFAHVRSALDARLAVVGPDDSGLLPSLKRLAASMGVDRHTDFVGPIFGRERLAALAAADVWALSSNAENFGIAVIEAMAAGRPVVISPHVNLAPEIAAAGAGVVAETDPEPFADALIGVLRDDRRRLELEEKGREFASGYDWSVVAPQLAEMYRRAASNR